MDFWLAVSNLQIYSVMHTFQKMPSYSLARFGLEIKPGEPIMLIHFCFGHKIG